MTSDKYEKMINASGGFTKTVKRGDRPQPLTNEDEIALTKAWNKIQLAGKTSDSEKSGRKKKKSPSDVKS